MKVGLAGATSPIVGQPTGVGDSIITRLVVEGVRALVVALSALVLTLGLKVGIAVSIEFDETLRAAIAG